MGIMLAGGYWKLRFPLPSVHSSLQRAHGSEQRKNEMPEEMTAIRRQVLSSESDMAKAHARIVNETSLLFQRQSPLNRRRRRQTPTPVYTDDDSSAGSQDNKDYDDSSNDYTSGSASGSDWDGSSGVHNLEENAYECYCLYEMYCTYFSYDHEAENNELAILRRWWDEFLAADRPWMYLLCNEWGFMASTNYGRNIWEDTLPVK